jgi:hypothetical protein
MCLLGFKKAASLLLGILEADILPCGAFKVVSVPWMVLEAAAGDLRGCYFILWGN